MGIPVIPISTNLIKIKIKCMYSSSFVSFNSFITNQFYCKSKLSFGLTNPDVFLFAYILSTFPGYHCLPFMSMQYKNELPDS